MRFCAQPAGWIQGIGDRPFGLAWLLTPLFVESVERPAVQQAAQAKLEPISLGFVSHALSSLDLHRTVADPRCGLPVGVDSIFRRIARMD